MKRSVLRTELQEWSGSLQFADTSLKVLDQAVATGTLPAWEPEEPEVLWESSSSELRLLDDGTWQIRMMSRWVVWNTLPYAQEVADELARRLLAENRARLSTDVLTDDYRERTFWVVDPETGKRELPVNAFRELELRRGGWVDVSPDAELDDEEIARERQHVTDGSPCRCEPETESPWHDEVERRLGFLESISGVTWRKKPDETS